MIRVFPAVPAAWPDAVLHNFRTQGAFLLSAARRAGITQFVRVLSLAGAACRLRAGIAGPLRVESADGRPPRWRQLPGGDLEVDLRQGQEILVYARGSDPDRTIAPVPPSAPTSPWGLP